MSTTQNKSSRSVDVTKSLVLGKKPEHIHVVIQEISEEDWALLAS
jgi:4-oxalocrotonate tautomerase